MKPYNDALEKVPPLLDKLNSLIADNKDQLSLTSKIELKYKAMLNAWSGNKNIPANKINYQRSLDLKRQMDGIRNDFSSFISNEEKL